MKVAIMQPYFMPYIGYFSLIEHADKFILFDVVQFIRHGWIERNRILKPSEGWQYIKVPLEKHSRDMTIKEIRINNHIDWKVQILRQLEHYKKRAPFYTDVCTLLQDCFDTQESSIVELNARLLSKTCEYIGIEFNYDIFSEMDIRIGEVTHAGEWALRISEALQAAEYINPIGGVEIFDKKQFEKANIGLKFIKANLREYNQKRDAFESGLSIIDVMMYNSKEEIQKMVKEYEIL